MKKQLFPHYNNIRDKKKVIKKTLKDMQFLFVKSNQFADFRGNHKQEEKDEEKKFKNLYNNKKKSFNFKVLDKINEKKKIAMIFKKI